MKQARFLRILKILLVIVALVPLTYAALFLVYYLPSTHKVQIVGTEVKRMEPKADTGPRAYAARDVRFILTRDPQNGESLVFRNEDTGWGWPPYFKFNSGDLAGDAASIKESQPGAVVLVTYYGWRIPMLDLFPNAVSLEIVDPRHTHIPWFNIVFLTVLGGGLAFLVVWLRHLWRAWQSKRRARQPAPPAPAATAPVDHASADPDLD
jgi:hypothetical protein